MTTLGAPNRTRRWRNWYCRKWNALGFCHAHHATQIPDSIVTVEIVTPEHVIGCTGVFCALDLARGERAAGRSRRVSSGRQRVHCKSVLVWKNAGLCDADFSMARKVWDIDAESSITSDWTARRNIMLRGGSQIAQLGPPGNFAPPSRVGLGPWAPCCPKNS